MNRKTLIAAVVAALVFVSLGMLLPNFMAQPPVKEVYTTLGTQHLNDLSRALEAFAEKRHRPARSLGELVEGGFFMANVVPQQQTQILARLEFPLATTNADQPTNATAAYQIDGKRLVYLLDPGKTVRAAED